MNVLKLFSYSFTKTNKTNILLNIFFFFKYRAKGDLIGSDVNLGGLLWLQDPGWSATFLWNSSDENKMPNMQWTPWLWMIKTAEQSFLGDGVEVFDIIGKWELLTSLMSNGRK